MDVFGDSIGGHVFNRVVHTCAVVSLTSCGCTDHVTHLRDKSAKSADYNIMFIHLNTIFTQRVVEGINVRITLYTYLSNHDREGKDSNKVVDKLEDNLKQGGGVRQTANGDEGLHRKVVTANVTEQRQSKEA